MIELLTIVIAAGMAGIIGFLFGYFYAWDKIEPILAAAEDALCECKDVQDGVKGLLQKYKD